VVVFFCDFLADRSGAYPNLIKPQENVVSHRREEIVAPEKIMVHLFIHPFGIATEQGIHPASGWSWKSELK